MYYSDRHTFIAMSAGYPVRHFGKNPHCFYVERFARPFYDLKMRDISVGINDEAASNSAFDTFFVGIKRISTCFIDESHQSFVATGELGFDIDKIKFKDLFIGTATVGRKAVAYPAGLSGSQRGHEKKYKK